MKIAIGIPTFNRASVLLDTIRDILQQHPRADEIVVVDQSDWYPEESKEALLDLAQKGDIRYFRQEEPNLPKARNRILNETDCDIVIFIDDDVLLTEGFVNAHTKNYFTEDVWAVSGGVTERDITVRPLIRRCWPKVLDYKHFDLGWRQRIEDFGNFKGCNHSVRRKVVRQLGGYDEMYTGVALREETDLALRIVNFGGRIVFDPGAHLHHIRAPAGGCRVNSWGAWTAGVCVVYFAFKNRKLLRSWDFFCELLKAYRLGVANKKNLRRPFVFIYLNFIFFKLIVSSSLYR